jgi:hypothetical protein
MGAGPDSWTIDDLRAHLQGAVELELLVIPPYLCALYSIEPGRNEEAALIIRSVVVEEMLHMILSANVLNAIGGRPVLAAGRWVPRYPTMLPYHRGRFEVGLRPLGDAALDTFLAIENPSYREGSPPRPSRAAAAPRLMTLSAPGYRTVGAFYHAIAHGLRSLVARRGERAVFSGDPSRQVGPNQYYAGGGGPIHVHDLRSALAAIDEVVEQGEGEVTRPRSGEKFDPALDLAHYYRFNELRRRRRYLVHDRPERPTGTAIELDLGAVYPMKPNLRTDELPTPGLRSAARSCNVIWTRLLGQLESALNGSPAELQHAVGTMFELKDAASDLLRIPLPGDPEGRHAGPTFELV